MVHTLAMLTVKTPEGSEFTHEDAADWSVTPGDERLVLMAKDDTGAEQPSNPKVIAEYARGAWSSVERKPDPE